MFKKGWALDISAFRIPCITRSFFDDDLFPKRIVICDVGIAFSKHLRFETMLDLFKNLLRRGPDLFEIDSFSRFVFSKRLRSQVDIDTASEGKSDDEGRG